MKIAVLAGGLSPERDVSLSSGSLIANSLIRSGHTVAFADVYIGLDRVPDDISELFRNDKTYSYTVPTRAPDLEEIKAGCGGREALIGPGIMELCAAADVVFIALHGAMGENGMLQAALDCAGIRRYTGTGYIGALLSMDKEIAKKMMSQSGVPVPEGIYYDTKKDTPDRILSEVGLPCVIKPSSCGSSVGVSRVYSADQLQKALDDGAAYERFLLAEKLISGRELTCAVLDRTALPPVEIIPKSGWYDYNNKYQSGATTELCPAPLTCEQTREIQRLSVLAFDALRMHMYGRADFILSDDGRFYCLEVNALPGMTPTSLLPQEAAAAGISYDELCNKLAYLAYNKAPWAV